MIINLLQRPSYLELMTSHIAQTLKFLIEERQDFLLLCEMKHLTFTPELPQEVAMKYKEHILFSLANYTLDGAHLDDENFYFEDGFGSSNIGLHVTIPLLAIKSIALGDNTPILTNNATYEPHNKASLERSSKKLRLNRKS